MFERREKKNSLQIIRKAGPGVFITYCQQNLKPLRQARVLFIWGGGRKNRKDRGRRWACCFASLLNTRSGSTPGWQSQATWQKFCLCVWSETAYSRAGRRWPQSCLLGIVCLTWDEHHIKILPLALQKQSPVHSATTPESARDNPFWCRKNIFCTVNK